MLGCQTICFDMSGVFCNILNQIVALVSSIIVNRHLLPYLLSMGFMASDALIGLCIKDHMKNKPKFHNYFVNNFFTKKYCLCRNWT